MHNTEYLDLGNNSNRKNFGVKYMEHNENSKIIDSISNLQKIHEKINKNLEKMNSLIETRNNTIMIIANNLDYIKRQNNDLLEKQKRLEQDKSTTQVQILKELQKEISSINKISKDIKEIING